MWLTCPKCDAEHVGYNRAETEATMMRVSENQDNNEID